jgi:hypothetical protein
MRGAYGGLVNLLTREVKEHIINIKDRCGPGGLLGKRPICLPMVSNRSWSTGW